MPQPPTDHPMVPEFDLLVDGSPLAAETAAYVVAVTVDDDVDLPSMFTLTLGGADTLGKSTPWVDEPLFAVGHVVDVKLGYGSDLESLMVGEITGLEPEFAFHQLPSLTVRGYDRRHRLQRGRKVRTFVQQKDSDIASQIASEAGLTAEVEDSEVTHDYVFQSNQTDMEFLRARAGRIHYEVVVEDKKLLFRPVPSAAGEALTLSFEEGLLEFYPRLTSMGQVSEVTVRSWSPKEKKELIGRAQSSDQSSTMGGRESGATSAESAFGATIDLVSARPVLTQAEADQMAKARFNDLTLDWIDGEGVCHGRADLRSGRVLKIEGVGERFSGQYYVTSAVHRYTVDRGYQTHFSVRRSSS